MNRRDWCRRTAQLAAFLAAGGPRDISSWQGTSTDTQRLRHLVHGNYELGTRLHGPRATVSFSGRQEVPNEAVLELSAGSVVPGAQHPRDAYGVEGVCRHRERPMERAVAEEGQLLPVLGRRRGRVD